MDRDLRHLLETPAAALDLPLPAAAALLARVVTLEAMLRARVVSAVATGNGEADEMLT